MSTVSVVALGKIGLPLAVAIAGSGHTVVGADADAGVVDLVNEGTAPFPNETDLEDRLNKVVRAGSLTATTDTSDAASRSSVVVVVVPLLVDDSARPDFTSIDAATEKVASGLKPGTTVIYETTVPVHTTRKRFAQLLSQVSGLELGTELFVAHSPERVFSGRVFADLARYPKLVGGIDDESSERAAEFYRSFLQFDRRPDLPRPNGVWNMGSAEAAEMAKLAETTYRDLNIAFANQLALGAEAAGVDVQAVIDACNSQPFSHIHQPGIAVGGHCIPVYPHLLASSVPEVTLSTAARTVNDAMPTHVVNELAEALGGLEGRTVTILGLAFRGGVKEHGFSGALALRELLQQRGATVEVEDPLYSAEEVQRLGFSSHLPGHPTDAVVLQATHEEFRRASSDAYPGARVVYDGRGWLDPGKWDGVTFLRIGAPR